MYVLYLVLSVPASALGTTEADTTEGRASHGKGFTALQAVDQFGLSNGVMSPTPVPVYKPQLRFGSGAMVAPVPIHTQHNPYELLLGSSDAKPVSVDVSISASLGDTAGQGPFRHVSVGPTPNDTLSLFFADVETQGLPFNGDPRRSVDPCESRLVPNGTVPGIAVWNSTFALPSGHRGVPRPQRKGLSHTFLCWWREIVICPRRRNSKVSTLIL